MWGVSSLQLVKADVPHLCHPGAQQRRTGTQNQISVLKALNIVSLCFSFHPPKKILLGGDKYHTESIHSTDIGKYYKSEPCFPKEPATNIYKLLFFMALDPAGIL